MTPETAVAAVKIEQELSQPETTFEPSYDASPMKFDTFGDDDDYGDVDEAGSLFSMEMLDVIPNKLEPASSVDGNEEINPDHLSESYFDGLEGLGF